MNLKLMDFRPYGNTVMQSWEQVGLYLRAIQQYNVQLFVEVGYCIGGLADFVAPPCMYQPGFYYLGIEHNPAYIRAVRRVAHQNAVYAEGDCFGDNFADELRAAQIKARKGRMLLLCDGGDKPRELAYFKDYLRVGDMIMAHDYGDEVSDADLGCMAGFREIEPERYRAALLPLFEKER